MGRHLRVGLELALCLGLLLANAPGTASADLVPTLNALRAEKDPKKRIALIPAVANHGGDRAAQALARLVRKDPDLNVRLAAARGLGRVKAKGIRGILVGEILHGGTLRVRLALGDAARRQKLGEGLIWVVESPRTPQVERELAVAAMGVFRDHATRAFLHRLARAPKAKLQEAAVRSIAARKDGEQERLRLFLKVLARSTDPAVLLAALDVVGPHVHPVLKPALIRLAANEKEDIAAAAAHVLERLARREAAEAAARAGKAGKQGKKAKKDDRYAKPDAEPPTPGRPPETPEFPPPPEHVPRPRVDVVWALDVTGSTNATLSRVLRRLVTHVEALRRSGQSVRVGVVAFRGGHTTRDHKRGLVVLPLTYDAGRVERFLRALRPGGVDDRGSAIPLALHVALDQMSWRVRAAREVRFEADGGCRNPDAAKTIVARHFRVDKTRSYFTFTLRTRKIVPPELEELAVLGGTRRLEILR